MTNILDRFFAITPDTRYVALLESDQLRSRELDRGHLSIGFELTANPLEHAAAIDSAARQCGLVA